MARSAPGDDRMGEFDVTAAAAAAKDREKGT